MSGEKTATTSHHRLNVLAFCLTFCGAVLVAQLFRYQVIDHENLKQDALDQRTWDKEIETHRGYIADANGHIIALDTIEWRVSASPPLVIHPDEVADLLSDLLGLSRDEVYAKLTSEASWVQLAVGVGYETGEVILERGEPGITCLPEHRRFYPEGELFGHVLGIVNNTGDGFYGVEGYYNQLLRGEPGHRRVEQNPIGVELPFSPLEETPPQPGTSLILTIDRNIQYIAQQELLRAIDEYGAESGTVLIMDPQTGAVLAAVSHPSYNPNDFAQAEIKRLSDPIVSQMWEPGSIFKIVTWAGGLDAGTISPGTTFYDAGALEVGGRVIRNWDRQGRGLVTMQDGLVQSLNTVASFISTSMGKDQFYTYLRRFGFGTLTKVDLASEGPGMIKLPGDSNWFPSELGTNSFGQGIAVTPMQMLVAASAVANKGMLMQPHIVEEMVTTDQDGTLRRIKLEPMMVRWAISQETAQTMTSMLVQVVEKGATNAQVAGYRIAGKTGTAQIPTAYGYHPSDTIGSFIGYAPADDPQFIVLVKLNKPTASPWGSQTAAPTFRAIAERLFVYLQIPPDEIRLAASQ